jgi:hypothetical protein
MNKEKMDELRGLSRNLDSATFRVDQISKNITKALKSEPLGPRDQNEVGDLTGQDLLNALTEANKNGHWKGWTFSELNRGGPILPCSVYDEQDNIIGHKAIVSSIVSYGNDKGEIRELTIMITDENGSRYIDFMPKDSLVMPQPRPLKRNALD